MTNGNQAQSAETKQSEISLDKQRERHKEISVTVRRTMFTLLAYSVSCGVIIAQPDVPFVLTSSGVKIPVINVAVNLKAFLLVGPLGLIAITTYLHLFLAKLDRTTGLDEYDKQPFLFNFKDRFSRSLGFLIFYTTPPIVMVAFSWKSSVIDLRIQMHFATMVVTVGMLLLYLKSRLKLRLKRRWFITVIFIIIGLLVLAGMYFISLVLGFHFERNLNLERAQLSEAKLTKVNLDYANLQFANLSGADLCKASLYGADLSGANISGANFEGTSLAYVTLEGTIIDDATRLDPQWKLVWELLNRPLTKKDLQKVDLSLSYLPNVLLTSTDLSGADLHFAVLHGARLHGAILNKANLWKADLREADLNGADLREADLKEADLRRAKNLTIEQLCGAKTLYKSKLDSELVKQVKEKCPHLLNKPKQ